MAPSAMRTGVQGAPVRRARSKRTQFQHSQVSDLQRSRMLAAAAEVTAEFGYAGMTVARVIARAGVSRRTFYDLFEDREDCFLAAFDEALACATAVVMPAYAEERAWIDRIRAGLTALLEFLDAEPGPRALLVVEVLSAGPRALKHRAGCLRALIGAVSQGGPKDKRDGEQSLAAEGVVGAVLSVIHTRAVERDPAPLIELRGALMSIIVLPYLGSSAARRELTRAVPHSQSRRRGPVKDPLEGLEMRLTYRTLRVLSVIADRPGVSNRDVAKEAGVTDQGQISRLLTRLASLGLITNEGAGHGKGASNAWRLSARGVEVAQTIRTQTRRWDAAVGPP